MLGTTTLHSGRDKAEVPSWTTIAKSRNAEKRKGHIQECGHATEDEKKRVRCARELRKKCERAEEDGDGKLQTQVHRSQRQEIIIPDSDVRRRIISVFWVINGDFTVIWP
eukprot:TRINITY_DN338_c0_g2_i4.p1 TRINITY_DN338_c0_g2~~TRINITY_DN338_c0_g2_i4.p1  ORF type:complete len:110 (-),score=9.16 TRINITY_DN338_c0_g2_i4:1285-1614(-)